ncbi:MAG: type II toxin-antitoxin system VapC family toxin [Nocardioidaceae bacterium]|nr:MAG: type II toxin-antitoxin system VapC family toxin [Nocardioidaceae bacterium]
MLVLDASVISEFLIASAVGKRAAELMSQHMGELHMPHLAVIETTSVLRTWVRREEVTESRAAAALADLADLPARRWPAEPLLARMWELRDNLTSYDASYVALAELLDAELLTADQRFAHGVKGLTSCPVVTIVASVEPD